MTTPDSSTSPSPMNFETFDEAVAHATAVGERMRAYFYAALTTAFPNEVFWVADQGSANWSLPGYPTTFDFSCDKNGWTCRTHPRSTGLPGYAQVEFRVYQKDLSTYTGISTQEFDALIELMTFVLHATGGNEFMGNPAYRTPVMQLQYYPTTPGFMLGAEGTHLDSGELRVVAHDPMGNEWYDNYKAELNDKIKSRVDVLRQKWPDRHTLRENAFFLYQKVSTEKAILPPGPLIDWSTDPDYLKQGVWTPSREQAAGK